MLLTPEQQALARTIVIGTSKVLTLTGYTMTYYASDNEWIAMSGAIISTISFILECILESLENQIARSELQHTKDRFQAYLNASNYKPTVQPTTSSLKTYGIAPEDSMYSTTPIILTNLASSAFNITNAFIRKTGFRTAAVATGTVSTGLNWLHQHFIQHNIKHENQLYTDGINAITNATVLNERPSPPPTYKR